MAKVYEKQCKSILTGKEGEYTLNPYFGCQHLCVYCYARYMLRFRKTNEDWGSFVEAKVNAPQVLEKELARKEAGEVMLSTACDPYQPLEEHRRITRECLERFRGADWQVFILTKSALAERDLDVISAIPGAKLACTITTFDEALRNRIEPGSSPAAERRKLLRRAAEKGIVVSAVLGPLARMFRTSGKFKGQKFVELVERTRLDEAFGRGREYKQLLSDGSALVDLIAWAQADFYRGEFDEAGVNHLLQYLAGKKKIPFSHWWKFIRKAPEVWLINTFNLARAPIPELLVVVRADVAAIMERLRSKGEFDDLL